MVLVTQGRRLPGYSRGKTRPIQIVLHEPVAATRDSAVDILADRGLSVHYTVERDATIEQHLDLKRAGAHAEGMAYPSLHNEESIGIEVCGIYYGHRIDDMKREHPDLYRDATVISGAWVDLAVSKKTGQAKNPERSYVVPTHQQLEALWGLIVELTNPAGTILPGSLIPRVFPACDDVGSEGVEFTWGRWKGHEGAQGIMAHHRWNHADGLFSEHYLLARLLGYQPADAYAVTLMRASSMRRQTLLARPFGMNGGVA